METGKNSLPVANSLLKDLSPGSSMEEEEEWLSIYVEDCLSSATSYTNFNPITNPLPSSTPSTPLPSLTPNLSSKNHPAVPGKFRTKRRRITTPRNLSTFDLTFSDPPLLHQTCWLAESELILLKREEREEEEEVKRQEITREEGGNLIVQQPRRCSHCLSQRTPQWRAGPLGPKTLCNPCGVRFKSGRLLPEYRPAKSPTFVSYKHSNSHKKVMMMRMAFQPSNSK